MKKLKTTTTPNKNLAAQGDVSILNPWEIYQSKKHNRGSKNPCISGLKIKRVLVVSVKRNLQ